MGLFDMLFGKKASPETEGPAEYQQVLARQHRYWVHNADEQSNLESRLPDLHWSEQLRLLQLQLLARLKRSSEQAESDLRRTIERLVALDSPYRPRMAMVWKGQVAQPGNEREPDLSGELMDPSLTHLGCLEVFDVDSNNNPVTLKFVGFDELSGVLFGPPALLRLAKLFYCDGRSEIALLPMLYGLTQSMGNEYDRAGQMTRFVGHVDGLDIGGLQSLGIGIGQHDLSIRDSKGSSLFGIGSVCEISFPLDMRDPKFDEKARARGIDPDDVRRKMKESPQ